jgi:ABC-type multidrug transport system permease subunit
MGSGLYGFGFVIVQARSRKLLKRLAATPMRKSDYLLAFLFSRLAFLLFEVGIIIVFTRIIFNVVIQGSLIAFALLALIGAMSSAGIGLLVAARPKTIEGVSALTNLITIPMWLLSGSFFSWSRFPEFLQPAIRLLPLTALNDSLRAVMNEGATLASTWPQICVMLAWGIVCFILAVRMFRWQ